jgi:hypothetical protein
VTFADLNEQNGPAKAGGFAMTGRIWLISCVAATIFSASGCITDGYDSAKLARNAGPTCDIPLAHRNQVYVFVMGGNNPVEMLALDKFRQGLSAQGFAKVATGPSIYSWWMASELRRIHSEEPTAVFVIAGLDSSASLAVKMSEKASDEGIPIREVVIVDPTGKTPTPQGGLRTLMIGTSYGIRGNSSVESLVITVPGQYGLSADTRTIDRVVQLLNEVAIENPPPAHKDTTSGWAYPLAPDVAISLESKPNSEWDFMFDRPGGMTRAIDEPLPPRAPTPASGNNTAVK